MQALRALSRKAGSSMCRALATLSEAPAARMGPGLPLVGLEPFRPAAAAAAAGIPWWTTMAVLQRQPANFSQGVAAAALLQRPAAAAAGSAAVRAPQQSALTEMWADSVRRKRKRAMNKHKHRKRRKLNRMSSRK